MTSSNVLFEKHRNIDKLKRVVHMYRGDAEHHDFFLLAGKLLRSIINFQHSMQLQMTIIWWLHVFLFTVVLHLFSLVGFRYFAIYAYISQSQSNMDSDKHEPQMTQCEFA